ncbi:hypothetical protein, partial [Klebsiella pneumoniae]|uniref:hypothetical protein n=1 Tax=Klebsiella pneumoniae TaxID=573 RepID=UPI0034DB2D4E
CVEQDDKGWDARKRAYCLKIQPATGSFARNLIYSTKPPESVLCVVRFWFQDNACTLVRSKRSLCPGK